MRLSLTDQDFDRELVAVKNAVLASSAVVRRIATADEKPVQQLGRALFANDVRVLFGASYQQARQQDAALRLVLRIQPPELARLPWEFLFDGRRGEYVGLRMPLVRYPQVMEPTRPVAGGPAPADPGNGRVARRSGRAGRQGRAAPVARGPRGTGA